VTRWIHSLSRASHFEPLSALVATDLVLGSKVAVVVHVGEGLAAVASVQRVGHVLGVVRTVAAAGEDRSGVGVGHREFLAVGRGFTSVSSGKPAKALRRLIPSQPDKVWPCTPAYKSAVGSNESRIRAYNQRCKRIAPLDVPVSRPEKER
jgi:hypothetical protein